MTGSISSLFSLLSWLIAWTPCLSESLWNPVPASFHRNLLRGILATCLKFEEKFGETIVRKVDEMGKIRILHMRPGFFYWAGLLVGFTAAANYEAYCGDTHQTRKQAIALRS